MPKIKTIFKRPVAKWGLLFCFALATAIIIHSCKKDSNPSENITDPEVLQAKSWYEGSFTTPGNNNGSKLNMQGSKLVNTTPSIDLSQYISPYWSKGTTYSRFNANVVELPAYAASKNVALSLNTALTAAQAKNTINSFIILKDSAGYHAYVMTLIADSTYTKNNPNILTQNKYNKRDTNFSGRVIYSTPNGKLVSSWRYVKGQLVSGSPYIGNNAKSNSLVANNNNTAHNYVTEECYTVYFYTVDPDGGEVAGSQQDLYTVCDVIINGSTSIPTAGSGAGNSNSPSKPSPCVPGGSASSAALYTAKGDYAKLRVVQQNVGFPAPATPCPPAATSPPAPAPKKTDTVVVNKLIKTPTTLTPAQIAALQNLLNQITSNCVGLGLINGLISGGQQFTFTVDNTITPQASYNPLSNSIQMRNPSSIDVNSFQEELFHAYQNFYYKGGTAQFLGKSGSANIEFEAKFLKDLKSTIYGGALTLQDSKYLDWLLTLTNDGKSFPTSLSTSDLSKYFQFMSEFNTQDLGYNNTIINNALNPTALINLINNSNCN